jgi:Flp pilus assembly protein TadG
MAGQTKEKPMKAHHQFIHRLKDQRGVSAVIVAIVLAVLIGFAALAIDIGYLYATKNELQNIADAGALAATGFLGNLYVGMTIAEIEEYNAADDADAIRGAAKSVVIDDGDGQNIAAGEDVSIRDADILINTWEGSVFNVNNFDQPNAVRVIARRDSLLNNAITTFFAKIIGIASVPVNADATAALTAPIQVQEGEMKLPFGISERQFDDPEEICEDEIEFSPTTDSCAGWHNFKDPINAADMKDKLIGFIRGHPLEDPTNPDPEHPDQFCPAGLLCGDDWLDEKFDIESPPDAATTPETGPGDDYEFQGGTISALFTGGWLVWQGDDNDVPVIDEAAGGRHKVIKADGEPGHYHNPAILPALFDYFRMRDGDGKNEIWTTTIPVYRDDPVNCLNPNEAIEIIGFATAVVRFPNPPPDSSVDINVYCDLTIVTGHGGGGEGPMKGSIPNLVE